MSSKHCSKCKQYLPMEAFNLRAAVRRSECLACAKVIRDKVKGVVKPAAAKPKPISHSWEMLGFRTTFYDHQVYDPHSSANRYRGSLP
jgi:hypothetical protein